MTLDEALQMLRDAQADLRSKGIVHAGVFGSTERGEQGAGSDIDILVDFDPSVPLTVFDYVGIRDDIAELFGQPVARDLVYAF